MFMLVFFMATVFILRKKSDTVSNRGYFYNALNWNASDFRAIDLFKPKLLFL